MRILFVHDRFGFMAGAEVNLYFTARELQKRGHAVGILHGPSTGKGEPEWQALFESRFPLREKVERNSTESALETFAADAVYVHKLSHLSVLEALLQSGVPVARMVHDHDLYCLRSYKYSPLTRAICTRAAGWHCVFPCGAMLVRNRNTMFPIGFRSFSAKRRELQLNRRFARMIVATDYMRGELVRNGFDPARIEVHAPVPPDRDDLPTSRFSQRNLLVYSGQVIRGKGVDVLLRALTQVRIPFECVILGDGHHREYCERMAAKLGLTDRVRFKGYVAPDQIAGFYSEAAAALVSSVWPEPFGAVGLEAMRHGLPVIAFDAGGIREWLDDGVNGFLVPWMDLANYAKRVEELLTDKALAQRLGANGRRLLRERFGFRRYIDGLEGLFARLAQPAQTALAR